MGVDESIFHTQLDFNLSITLAAAVLSGTILYFILILFWSQNPHPGSKPHFYIRPHCPEFPALMTNDQNGSNRALNTIMNVEGLIYNFEGFKYKMKTRVFPWKIDALFSKIHHLCHIEWNPI